MLYLHLILTLAAAAIFIFFLIILCRHNACLASSCLSCIGVYFSVFNSLEINEINTSKRLNQSTSGFSALVVNKDNTCVDIVQSTQHINKGQPEVGTFKTTTGINTGV